MATRTTKKEWRTVELGSLCDAIVGGGTPTTKNENYWRGEIPWITSKWLGDKMYLYDGEKKISEDAVKHSATHIIPKDSLIFATRVGVGKVGINCIPLAINQDLAGLVIAKDADVSFLAYQLTTDRVKKYVASLRRGATIQGITREDLKQVLIHFPVLYEQKAIAKALTTVQDAIAEQENLIAKLKELKRSMMQHLFTHGTKGEATKMTEIGEIPESWKTVELIGVCDKPQYGFTDSASKNGNVKFLRITDITENGVNWNTVPFCSCSEPEKYLLHDGDIVFARIGATTGKSFLLKNPDNAVYASYLIRVRAKAIDSSFLYHYFQTGAYWKQIDSQKGMNLKGGVNGSILSKLLVPMCNGDEQLKIAASLNTIDARVESAQAKLASYQDLFKTLLHELMSGERRIKIV